MKSIALVFGLLLSIVSFGQNDSIKVEFNKKPFIYFHGGISFPLGDFGETEDLSTDGYAQNGRSIGLGLLIPLQKGLSLDFGYSYNTYSIDRIAFDEQSEVEIRRGLSGVITNDFKYSSDVGTYKNSNLILGLKIDAKIDDIVSLYFTPGFAVTWFNVPSVTISIKDGVDEITSKQSSPRTNTITYSLAAGATFQLSSGFEMFVHGGYLNAEHDTEYTVAAEDQNGNRISQVANSSDQVSMITVSLGVRVRLK